MSKTSLSDAGTHPAAAAAGGRGAGGQASVSGAARGSLHGSAHSPAAPQGLAADLDAIAALAVDHTVLTRLQLARRAALARLDRGAPALTERWFDWAPVGLALTLVLVTSWSLLTDNAQSVDADLLADALPFDAYLDADFEAAVGGDTVRLLEN